MKKLVPVVITVILISYLAFYLWIPIQVFKTSEPFIGKVIGSAVGAAAIGMIVAAIYTLVVRLREIDKEDKDDLSKY